jgi:hypothetical protein
MKIERLLTFTLILLLLAQTACTFSVDVVPTPTSPGATQPVASAIPSESADADGCPSSQTGDAVPYRNDEDGYCLLYPQNFTVIPPRFIVFNPTNAPGDKLGDAVVDIRVEPANGRTADQVAADAIAAAGQGFNIQMDEVVVDDTQAFAVDGIPGQDPMRNVYIVSHDRLYMITFMPWGNNPELETAYEWITKTLHFLP